MDITKSFHADEIKKQWFVVDAKDQVLGRLCSNIAKILRGKHKPTFTPNIDAGDFVIVINSSKIKITGKKSVVKEYHHYTGYPGGLRKEKYSDLLVSNPAKIIEHAVKGMLPHNKLGRQLIMKLKVYGGAEHPHAAQNPSLIKITK